MTFRQKTMAKLGKEPATPGYTGYIPALRNHLIGHSYGDSTRRAAACTDSLRKKEYEKAIELTVESRPQDRNFFYAQLSRAALEQPPKAIRWIASKRDLPPDMTATSGLMDIRKMHTCIGTTPAGVTTCPPHMSIPDPPYKDRHLCTKREFEKLKDDCLEVAEARHHIKGYSGHYHGKQHVYGKSYGKTARILRPLPADPRTSREFQFYCDNRALVTNEFELKHKMHYNHFTLLPPGHKPGGHGHIEGRMEQIAEFNSPSDAPRTSGSGPSEDLDLECSNQTLIPYSASESWPSSRQTMIEQNTGSSPASGQPDISTDLIAHTEPTPPTCNCTHLPEMGSALASHEAGAGPSGSTHYRGSTSEPLVYYELPARSREQWRWPEKVPMARDKR